MKKIRKNEIYQNISAFLKAKGIELTEGGYASSIQNCCSFLTDTINLSQQGISRAKTEVDRALDQMRQVIHEKTAPRQAGTPAPAPGPKSPKANGKTKPTAGRAATGSSRKPRKKTGK